MKHPGPFSPSTLVKGLGPPLLLLASALGFLQMEFSQKIHEAASGSSNKPSATAPDHRETTSLLTKIRANMQKLLEGLSDNK